MSTPVTSTDDSEAPAPVDEESLCGRRGVVIWRLTNELVRRHQERIYATIYHMTSNHEDANDLAQESFIKAFQALKSFKGGSSFYTWLYRIAVNKTINFLKQRKNRIHMSLNDLDFNTEHNPDLVALISEKTPLREVNLAELQEKLNNACSNCQNHIDWLWFCMMCRECPMTKSRRSWKVTSARCDRGCFYARQQLQALLSDYLQ